MRALHGPRLEAFLGQAIDTTMRGFVYEVRTRAADADGAAEGERIVSAIAERNAIPVAFVRADPERSRQAGSRMPREAIDCAARRAFDQWISVCGPAAGSGFGMRFAILINLPKADRIS